MQTSQGNMLQSLRNVQKFLDDNAAALSGVMQTGARRRLDDAISELSNHASVQTGSHIASQGATRQTIALRRTLLDDYMAPIARVARADLPNTPAIEPLRMPKRRTSTERLAAAAYGMAKAAVPFGPVFIAAGLPDDFVARLNGAADAMLASVGDRAQNQGKRSGATQGLAKKLTEGRKVVGILDAFVRTALKTDPALLANWNQVRRVQRVAARAQATAPTPNAPTPPAAPTPAPVGG